MKRSRFAALTWVERVLWIAAATIGLWTLFVVAQNAYYARLPVPDAHSPQATRRLPGESPTETVGTSGAIARNVEPGAWVARLEAPTVNLKATVLEGSDDRTLRRAAGHIEYTPLPGEPGNIGIAGHRDTTFYPLRKVKAGDRLTLTTASDIFEYEVRDTRIVEPEDIQVLDPTNRSTITLVTCYPFNFVGNAPKRFIVRGELISGRPRS
jgi:LPXTG-site transpeptidase (sortase) family protein